MRAEDSQPATRKLSLSEAYVMAVGGMIGGGIFSVLGLVVDISGHLAAVAFLIAGTLTLITGLSYARQYERYKEAGGSFAFVRRATGRVTLAGHIGWALILGYVFTNSLYAFTFGHYLANVFAAPRWVAPLAAVSVTTAILGVNLLGVGQSGWTELVTVWGKLALLSGLAAIGLWRFDGARLQPLNDQGFLSPFIAAAVVFIAFEGFQLLTYDVDQMEAPERNLKRAMLPAIGTATMIYVVVTIAALMLVKETELIAQREVALAIAGKEALGTTGLGLITVAALFSTASAINATLFATANLSVLIAREGQLPSWLAHRGDDNVPRRALVAIAAAGAVFAVLGNIEQIVTFASLTFLLVFAVVNALEAWQAESLNARWLPAFAAVALVLALLTVVFWLATNRTSALLVAGGVALGLSGARWAFLRRLASTNPVPPAV